MEITWKHAIVQDNHFTLDKLIYVHRGVIPPGGEVVLTYLGMVERFRGDDPRF